MQSKATSSISRSVGEGSGLVEADAGDAAAGDLVDGEGLAVFVGEVEDCKAEAMACPSQPVSFGGLFQPVDEVLARSSLAAAARSSRRG